MFAISRLHTLIQKNSKKLFHVYTQIQKNLFLVYIHTPHFYAKKNKKIIILGNIGGSHELSLFLLKRYSFFMLLSFLGDAFLYFFIDFYL